jgi:hypothetical protein
MGNEILDAAYRYTDMGLRVIALSGKMPNALIHRHGLHDSLDVNADDVQLQWAFNNHATTGIGILTGPVYYVVDIDGEEGAREWRNIAGRLLPTRWVARTGRGLHIWYADYRAWPTAKLASKLDFKGVGGYVAAPPSLHPSGVRYEWLLEPEKDEPPFAMPEALESLLLEREALRAEAIRGKQMRRQVPPDQRIPGLIYSDVPVDGIIDAVKAAQSGNRNNVLFWAAATLYEEGADEATFARLLDAAIEVGLDRIEARRTIRSANRTVSNE